MSTDLFKAANPPTVQTHLAQPTYRPDIDGLRALAVALVVIYHAFPSALEGGFIGVDIFFVISGFLISTIIFKSFDRGHFSFYEFYSRRIRRIFPALLVVLISCYALGWFALLPDEYKQLGKQMAGGAGFVSNFVLWSESGYFDTAAETKPLLHLWSLGIEEQFYIIWPILVWFAWKRNFNILTVIIVLILISFLFNLMNYRIDRVANFYSPQTRFWELLIGSLLAFIANRNFRAIAFTVDQLDSWLARIIYAQQYAREGETVRNALSVFGLLLIVVCLFYVTKESYFPGLWALLPVLGSTCIIAAGPNAWFNKVFLSNRFMVWLGFISFPLYLWHWPLLSYARIVEGDVPALSIRVTAVVLSVVLAWLTYKFVERPLRFGGRNAAKVSVLLFMMAVVGYAGYNTYERNGLGFRTSIRQFEELHHQIKWYEDDHSDIVCQKQFGTNFKYCKLTKDAAPTVALIGDSIANSFFYGLSAQLEKSGENLVMLGAGGCPPLMDITSGLSGQADWCESMTSNALKKVSQFENIHTVILASNWHLYINGMRFHYNFDVKWEIRATEAAADNIDVFNRQFKKAIELLLQAGKNIVVLKQTPELNFSPKNCLMARPLSITSKTIPCEVSAADVRSYLYAYENILEETLSDYPSVKILDPFPIFCSDVICSAMHNGHLIYRDGVHLSRYGSIYLFSQLLIPLRSLTR